MLALQVLTDPNFWKDALPIVTNIATGSIVIFFLKKKIDTMNVQINSLKGQVESQQGILNTTKVYFEIFDLGKLKEYAVIAEEKAKMEARLAHQAEIDLLKEEGLVKKGLLEAALQTADSSSEQLELLHQALNTKLDEAEQLQKSLIESRFKEQASNDKIFQMSQELRLAQSIASIGGSQPKEHIGLGYSNIKHNHYTRLVLPPIPKELADLVDSKQVYDLLITYPFEKLNYDETIASVRETITNKTPHLNTEILRKTLHRYITEMAVVTMGENVWNSNMGQVYR
jgi:hypothetical protein